MAVALWFAASLLGRDLVSGVVAQNVAGYPNVGQIDAMIVWPTYVIVALLTCAWVANAFQRGPWILGLLSGAAIIALFPFMVLFWGGGM